MGKAAIQTGGPVASFLEGTELRLIYLGAGGEMGEVCKGEGVKLFFWERGDGLSPSDSIRNRQRYLKGNVSRLRMPAKDYL
jgi:hypothetical protein